nr:hypothetical protein [uncultured Ruegeria sp.]
MRQVVAQNIVPNNMCETGAKQVELFKRGFQVTFPMSDPLSVAFRPGCKGEDLGFLGINLQINRQTARQDFELFPRHLNMLNSRRNSLGDFKWLLFATAKGLRYAAGN